MSVDIPPAVAAPQTFAHAAASFEFLIEAPLPEAAPLFGPEGERAWAGAEWDPRFLHPSPAGDIEGAVFTTTHGPQRSVWVNTQFDLTQGRIQYVVFLPGVMTTTITVRLSAHGARTRASVTYARTALSPEANDRVAEASRNDATKGPEWRDAIAAMLRGRPRD